MKVAARRCVACPDPQQNDLTLDYGYNPAGQIVSTVRSNDAYAWGGHYAVTRSYTANGLNQYSAAGSASLTYGDRGNLATTPGPGVSETLTFAYDSENLLTGRTSNGSSPTVSLTYDPATRLYETAGGTTTRMAYDGDTMIAEYNGSNALQRRYVFGPGGEPLVSYDVPNSSAPSYYHADERGSVIATSDGSGAMATINSYDEYGIPASGNSGRFQYTGQQWLAELGMQYSRARIYSPTLGRFMQTDPIGVSGGINLYGYVTNDPVNATDPSGLTRSGCAGADVCGPHRDDRCDDESAQWDNTNPCVTIYDASWDTTDYEGGSGGSGDEAATPPICNGITRNGNNISIRTPVQFYYKNYSATWTPLEQLTSATADDAAYFLDLLNNSSIWDGQIGPYNVDVNMSQGPGGLTVFIGSPQTHAEGGEIANPRVMFVGRTQFRAMDAIYVAHGLGHSLGNFIDGSHSLRPPNIMSANPFANPVANPDHIETAIRICNLTGG